MKDESTGIIRLHPRLPRLSARERFHVVIIGGGFSGTALAAQLVRRGDGRLRITLLDANERLGRGLPYATMSEAHVLNTRARDMSLYPEEPDDFVWWLRRHGLPNAAGDFVARKHFGDYLEDALVETSLRAAQRDIRFVARSGTEVVDVMANSSGLLVALDDASTLGCDAVVIATGHPKPRDVLRRWLPGGHERWLRDPWDGRLDATRKKDRILMIGSGLTMIDKVLELDSYGHEGPIHVLSRRGLVPRGHRRRPEVLPADLREALACGLSRATTPRGMLRVTRRAIAAADRRGLTWHAVIDAMRPLISEVWSGMPLSARRRFLKRLRPWWEVHRHRMAPASSVAIRAMIKRGRLEIRTGNVRYAADDGPGLLIGQALRGETGRRRERYDWVINCTGSDRGRANRPLDRRLIERGLLAEDALGIGYATTGDGEVMTADGPVRNIYLLGAARRPQNWESTAVPDLRTHAAQVATALVGKADFLAKRNRHRQTSRPGSLRP